MGDYSTKALVRRRRVCENVLPVFFSFVLCLLAAKATAVPLQISGNHAFLTDPSGRLQIVNIANGTNPVIVTTYPNFGGVSGISLHGAYASATLTNDGLIVFDVTQQPPALVPGGRYVTSGNARDVQVVESTAFVADGTNGIVFLDLFDVHTPLNLFTLGVPGSVSALEVRQDYLYAAAVSGGLRIYDVTALNDPEFVGSGARQSLPVVCAWWEITLMSPVMAGGSKSSTSRIQRRRA